jgi:23S rRNA (uracil1939-C5)-methyltransferase
LSQLKSKDYITVDIDLKPEDLTASEAKPTYAEIRDYILEHHNVKVSSLYIVQIKRKYGLDFGESYNKPKHDNSRQAHCPPDKEELIKEAFRFYKLI